MKRRIFISSPSDVQPERERIEKVVQALNAEIESLELEVVRWEDKVYRASATFQDQVTTPAECDLVVCLFWKRLGTPLPEQYAREDGTSPSGTEYEFEQAIQAARRNPSSLPDIFVYRKTAPVHFSEERLDEERAEKRALDEFWQRWFQDEEGHFLAAFDTFETTDEFARQFERHLRQWLQERSRAEWDITLHGSPFRGLEAFDESHAPVFFGRRQAIERSRARLMAGAEKGSSSLFLIGASGSGKSSLLRAGILPCLRVPDRTAPYVHRWRRVVMSPGQLGTDVATGLARALYADDVLPELRAGDYPDPEGLGALLARSPEDGLRPIVSALDRWANALAEEEGHREPPVTGLLVAIDQFEEIFQLEPDRRRILIAILNAIAHANRLWLIATLRSDFYPALQADPDSMGLKDKSLTLDVPPPGPGDVREILEGASRAAGLTLESNEERSLLEELESDASEPGALPMLQFALQALFEARDRDRNLLRLADYDWLGGAAGALATEAERIFTAVEEAPGEDKDQALAAVLRRLVEVDIEHRDRAPQARPAPLDEFPPGSTQRRLVEALQEARLLVAYANPGSQAPLVRVAHESLFRHWPRAADQIARDHRDLETRARIAQAQHLWMDSPAEERQQRLLRGLPLEEARDLERRWGEQLPEELRSFIARSRRAAKGRRKRRQAMVAAVMGVLAIFAGSATWFAITADQARQEAETARAQSDQVIELQQELLGDMEPETIAGRMIEQFHHSTEEGEDPESLRQAFDELARLASPVDVVRDLLVEQILDPTEGRLQEQFAEEPVVRARLQSSMGAIHRNWGNYERADVLTREAWKTLDQELGADHGLTLRAQTRLATLLLAQGRHDEARDFLEESVEMSREQLGLRHPTTLHLKDNLAETLRLERNLEEALALQERVVELRRAEQGDTNPQTLAAKNNLALLLDELDEVEEARSLYERVYERRREIHGDNHPDTLITLNNLAQIKGHQGEIEEARELQKNVLDGRRQSLGEDHPQTLTAQYNLAFTHHMLGNIGQAKPLFEDTLVRQQRLLGDDHRHTLLTRMYLGEVLTKLDRAGAAREHLEAAADQAPEVFGDKHPQSVHVTLSLAQLYTDTGDSGPARELVGSQLAWLYESDPDALDETHQEQRAQLESLKDQWE